MKNQRDTSLKIRLAALAMISLFVALGAVAYLSGQQVERDSELVVNDAVPGTIAAHKMRMAMSRGIGWVMVAASARTTQSRDDSLKIVHDSDTAFTDAAEQYRATTKIHPGMDKTLLEKVTSQYAKYRQQRMTYEALILAGDRDGSAAFLERDLVPAYVPVIKFTEDLVSYNNDNSIAYANHIRDSVHQLYWAVAVVLTLAIICAAVLILNLSIRRREVIELRESEERFSKAFRSNPSGIAITKMETGEYIEANESFCRIMGCSPEELIGRNSMELGFWSEVADRNRVVQSLHRGDTLRDLELQIRTRGGDSRTVLLNAESIELGGRQCIVSLVQDITERKRATEQIEMLKVSIDQHFDAAYWMDTDNRFVYVNDASCKALGYAREELLGKPLALIAPRVTPQILEDVWKHLRETGSVTREGMHRRKDGSEFPVEIVASYVRFEGKEFNCGFARDITERKQREEILHLRERALAEVSQGVFIYDENRQVTYVNSSFTKMTGYEEHEILGRNCSILQGADTDSDAFRKLRAAQDAHETFDGEILNYRKDGTPFWNELSLAPIPSANGGHPQYIGILRDITDRKRIEEALLWRTAFFEAQVDSALDGILVVDRDGKKILQNQRLNDLWKIPPEIAADDNDAPQIEFIRASVKNPAQFVEKVAHLYAHPDEVGRDEIELIDGTILDRFSSPVYGNDGRHYGRIWTFRDVTKERSREEKLARALALEKELSEKARAGERAKGEFLAVMSHEVRTPLNGILGFSEMLARTQLPPESQEYVQTITSSGEALLRILDDILDFSRIDAGHLPIEKICFAPREILSEIHSLFARQADHAKLEFEVSAVENIPQHLNGDANRIRQILLNLVGNAIKFTDAGSVTLHLRRKSDSNTYEFVVSDTGPGVTADQLARIFLPFTQADSSISRRHGGAGLGLSISRRLAELMGGTLEVRSEQGHGAEFLLAVPLDEIAAPPKKTNATSRKLDATFASRHPLRILTVEDDKVNLKLLLALLRRLGYAAVGARNGCEAVAAYEKERPDCILMDLQMPEMDGIEATEKIREMERNSPGGHPAFIVALTANIVPADRQRCFDAGMNDYMNKPVKIDVLAALLETAAVVAANGAA